MAGHGAEEHPHGADRLCEAGDRVYSRAVRRGRVPRGDAEPVPCLLELALLHPDPDDMDWLVPTSPQEVMTRLLRGMYDEVNASQRRVGSAVAAVEWYAGLGRRVRPVPSAGEGSAIRVLDGLARIQAAVDEATQACTTEVLTVQPGGIRREAELSEGLHRALALRGRGVRMRDLYTHVARHGQGLLTYLELMGDAVEARTLDEVIDRLILFDRTVAFIPANTDRTMALELRHPRSSSTWSPCSSGCGDSPSPDRAAPRDRHRGHLPPGTVHRGPAGGGPPGRGDRGTAGDKRPDVPGAHRPPLGDAGSGQPYATGRTHRPGRPGRPTALGRGLQGSRSRIPDRPMRNPSCARL